jgi:tetratricopeptide (TPR) repeat protein
MTRRASRGRLGAAACAIAVACGLLATDRLALADCSHDAAESAYADARRAFVEKRYDDSVALLRQAYACDPKPVYLGNIARTYEEANRPRDALEAWRAFLAVVADERDRSVTAGRISVLAKIVDDLDRLEREKETAEEARRNAEAAARDAARPPPEEPTQGHHVPAAAWITASVGVAGLATGVALGIVAQSKHNQAIADTSANASNADESDARNLAQATNWTLAIGGAVAAVGMTWIGIDLLRPVSTNPSARAALVVMGSSVAVAGTF